MGTDEVEDTATTAGFVSSSSCAEIRFRNYVPKDPKLRQFCLPRPSIDELQKQIDKEAKEAIEAAKEEDILSQVVPRRPNWDLKRDVERKITILSRRTDKAIIQLIKEKIEKNKKEKEMLNEEENADAKDDETGTERLSREAVEIRQTVLNGINEFDKIDDDDEI